MVQPKRNGTKDVVHKKKRTKKILDERIPPKKNIKPKKKWYQKEHAEYGTSKLEEKFAKNFLDKLGIKYVYQFKAESIGRYFDFYLPEYNVLIDIDGDYYHSFNLTEEQMSPMQKKNKRVDIQKTHWALVNCIPLLRIWEHDINEHSDSVIRQLKEFIGLAKDELDRKNNFKKRH